MPTRIPHTYRTSSGTYYFRYVWPKALLESQPALGRDLRFSLETKCYSIAKALLHENLVKVNKLTRLLIKYPYNSVLSVTGDLSIRELKTAETTLNKQGELFFTQIKGDSSMNLNVKEYRCPDGGAIAFDGSSDQDIDILAKLIAKRSVYQRFYENELSEEPLPASHILPLQKSSFRGMKQNTSVNNGVDFCGSDTAIIYPEDPFSAVPDVGTSKPTVATNVPVVYQEPSNLTGLHNVKDLVDDFIEEKAGDWVNKSTRKKYLGQLRVLTELLGAETPLSSLTTQTIVHLKRTLAEYPIQRFVGRRAVIPLVELMADSAVMRISNKTAKGYFELLKSVIANGAEGGHMKNVARDVRLKSDKKKSSQYGEAGLDDHKKDRPSFNEADLIKLFTGYVYGGQFDGNSRLLLPAHFWIPLISMYSGMRINEACQLMISDIATETVSHTSEHQSITYFRITDKHPDQVIKTDNSRRNIPVHGVLAQLGFLDFVERRKSESKDPDNEMLFEGMRWDDASRWGRVIGRWFNGEKGHPGYITSALGSDRGKKVFHSFRHTVTDVFRNSKVDKELYVAVIGHEDSSTTGLYGEGFELHKMKEAVDQIQYSPVITKVIESLDFTKFEQFAKSIKPRKAHYNSRQKSSLQSDAVSEGGE